MHSSFDGLEVSAVSKKRTPGTSGFDAYHEDDDPFLDLDICFDVKDEELDLEEDYLEKLKVQRERMEKLSRAYQDKEQQLEREAVKNEELLNEIEKMVILMPFKENYDDLKVHYEDLAMKHQLTQEELADVKDELSKVVFENNQTISRLKGELKSWKETSNMSVCQLEQSICDKEEEMKKIRREWKDKEDALCEEIKYMKNTIAKAKSQLENESKAYDKERERWGYEMKMRDNTIIELQKSLQMCRKQNVDLKNEIMRSTEQVKNREQDLTTICNKFKSQLTVTRKAMHDKENTLEDTQSELKKSQSLTCELQTEIDEMKIDFRKTCEMYEHSNKKMKHDNESEILRLESFIKELKESIEELMEVKNHLICENRKLMAILKKKQQQEKHRKQMLRTEWKEIDKIEKVIDRLH